MSALQPGWHAEHTNIQANLQEREKQMATAQQTMQSYEVMGGQSLKATSRNSRLGPS